eukprot:6173202-Pleurochrysis_carterae.AAC.7
MNTGTHAGLSSDTEQHPVGRSNCGRARVDVAKNHRCVGFATGGAYCGAPPNSIRVYSWRQKRTGTSPLANIILNQSASSTNGKRDVGRK